MRFDGQKLRGARDAKGMTRAELAVKAGVGFNTVGRAERGEVGVSVETIAVFASILEINPGELFTEEAVA
jgi:transcriptional regulator with XRE-family HTH domain